MVLYINKVAAFKLILKQRKTLMQKLAPIDICDTCSALGKQMAIRPFVHVVCRKGFFTIMNREKEEKRFRIAFSFPGEHRSLVDEIANGAANVFSKNCILYDWFHRAEFARPNLDIHLQNLYKNESELIVVFICATYNRKKWCGIEWRAIRELLNSKEADDRILFIKCAEGNVDGVFNSIDGYIDATHIPVQDIIQDIVSRYYSISNLKNSICCSHDIDSFAHTITPAKLFNILFGKSSIPILITDSPISNSASTFYRYILPQRLIQINPTLWDSSSRRSRLFNKRAEKKYIEKMFYPICYEKQVDVLIENCQYFLKKNNTTINFIALEIFINEIKSSIIKCQLKEKKRQEQEHPGMICHSDEDLSCFLRYLEDTPIQNNEAEILSILVLFSFMHERVESIILHYESNRTHVLEATSWMVMPFYSDDKLLLSAYMAICGKSVEDISPNDRINYNLICNSLTKKLGENNGIINLSASIDREHLDDSLVLISGSFLLEDLYGEGHHLEDFQHDIFKLLDIDQSKCTFMFSAINKDSLSIRMFASGSKFNIRFGHLLQIIYESDRVFPLNIIGYSKAIKENNFSIKPLIIGYDGKHRFWWKEIYSNK